MLSLPQSTLRFHTHTHNIYLSLIHTILHYLYCDDCYNNHRN